MYSFQNKNRTFTIFFRKPLKRLKQFLPIIFKSINTEYHVNKYKLISNTSNLTARGNNRKPSISV